MFIHLALIIGALWQNWSPWDISLMGIFEVLTHVFHTSRLSISGMRFDSILRDIQYGRLIVCL